MPVKQKRDPYADHYAKLVGKTIKGVCLDDSGDIGTVYGLIFSDDTKAWIMCDPEGNGPGFLEIE